MNKKAILLLVTLLSVICGLYFTHSSKKDAIYYVQTKSGEEFLCWDGGCGWNRGTTVDLLYSGDASSVPAIVTKNIADADIAVKKKMVTYSHDPKQTYSSLKGFIIEGNKVVFSLLDFNKSSLFVWDKQTDKSRLITTSDNYLWPISLQPAGNLVLVSEVDSTSHKTTETIFHLLEDKRSSPMTLATFKWGDADTYVGSEYLGFKATLPEYTCPYYADILNCLANKRRATYWDRIEAQRNQLDFGWISLSLPTNWEYQISNNAIHGKNVLLDIVTGTEKRKILDVLSTCFTKTANSQGKSANGLIYQVTQYTDTKRCDPPVYEKVIVIKHKEFADSSLVLGESVIPEVASSVSTSVINAEINEFLSSLKNAILY